MTGLIGGAPKHVLINQVYKLVVGQIAIGVLKLRHIQEAVQNGGQRLMLEIVLIEPEFPTSKIRIAAERSNVVFDDG